MNAGHVPQRCGLYPCIHSSFRQHETGAEAFCLVTLYASVSCVLARLAVRLLCVIGWGALPACSANDDIPAPALSALVPDEAVPGATVMLTGSSLCQEPRTNDGDGDPLACQHMGTVMFDTAPGAVISYADTVVLVEVPALPPGRVSVSLSVAGRI